MGHDIIGNGDLSGLLKDPEFEAMFVMCALLMTGSQNECEAMSSYPKRLLEKEHV